MSSRSQTWPNATRPSFEESATAMTRCEALAAPRFTAVSASR